MDWYSGTIVMTLALTLSSQPVMRQHSALKSCFGSFFLNLYVASGDPYMLTSRSCDFCNRHHWFFFLSCVRLDNLGPAYRHCCCLEEVVAVWSRLQFSICTHAPNYHCCHSYLEIVIQLLSTSL